MIYFDSIEKIFYLETKATTYAIAIFQDKVLVHLYWGKKINRNLKNDYCKKFKRKRLMGADLEAFSTDGMPLEFSTFGSADYRTPTFRAVHSDGNQITKFMYADYKIIKGKPMLAGLPATYCEDGDNVQTLIIRLHDNLKKY